MCGTGKYSVSFLFFQTAARWMNLDYSKRDKGWKILPLVEHNSFTESSGHSYVKECANIAYDLRMLKNLSAGLCKLDSLKVLSLPICSFKSHNHCYLGCFHALGAQNWGSCYARCVSSDEGDHAKIMLTSHYLSLISVASLNSSTDDVFKKTA